MMSNTGAFSSWGVNSQQWCLVRHCNQMTGVVQTIIDFQVKVRD